MKICKKCKKTIYPHSIEAVRVQFKIFKQKGMELRVYRCPSGYGYHLTKTPKVG